MWKETYNSISTDGATHTIMCEYYVDFPQSRWNKNLESPVIRLRWTDYKKERSWPLCHAKVCLGYPRTDCKDCVVHTQGLFRKADIHFNYCQRMPDRDILSGRKGGSNYNPALDNYDEITLEYCQARALEMFKENLTELLKQL